MKMKLDPENRQVLEAGYKATREKRIANRINVLLLLDDGYTYEEIAEILRLDDETIRRTERDFIDVGLIDFLKSPFSGGVCKLSEDQLVELERYVEENLCETTAQVADYVHEKFGISYTPAGICELLKRLDFVYKKPTIIPGKADLAMQLEFMDYYETIKATMGKGDKIYFVDGVHPQHNSMPSHGWIKKGKDRPLESNTGRQRVNINGALDPDTLEVIAKADDTLDSSSTISFLKLIEEKNLEADTIVLIVDNARYYYNGDVVDYVSKSKQLEMIFLPPYSPNLNLIERLWKFMKKKVMYNRYYPTFKGFKEAIGAFFERLPEHYDELCGIITEEFQIVPTTS
jgi:transposase